MKREGKSMTKKERKMIDKKNKEKNLLAKKGSEKEESKGRHL